MGRIHGGESKSLAVCQSVTLDSKPSLSIYTSHETDHHGSVYVVIREGGSGYFESVVFKLQT